MDIEVDKIQYILECTVNQIVLCFLALFTRKLCDSLSLKQFDLSDLSSSMKKMGSISKPQKS